MPKSTNLFEEFNPVSAKEWKQQIQMELKGADYSDTLVWQSLEGIDVKPFYHPQEYDYLEIPIPNGNYKICQTIFVDDPAVANKIAIEVLSKGADSVQFIATHSFDVDVLFQNFDTLKNKPTIYIKSQFLSHQFIDSLLNYFDDDSVNIQQDIVGQLVNSGNWFINEINDFDVLKKLISKHPNKQILSVDAAIYQNAGASIVQQIAYALGHANEYLTAFGKDISNTILFEFAVGSNYFFEIAKIRAFRYLWQQITAEYGQETAARIIAKPSNRNKTLYDYNVNMLRTSTEYMSAILGGVDIVATRPYDHIFKKSNHFSNRIARNQLLILREENGFEEAYSFAKGSYYIETLTVEIAKKALQLFKDIEKTGGFLSNLKSDLIQRKIKEVAEKEQVLFDDGKLSLVGTNKYPNSDDKMKEVIELYPFLKYSKKQTLIQPILPKRLAEKIEQERISNE